MLTKLDGQEGTYYLNYSNFTNTPTIPTNNNQLTNGAGYITTSFTSTSQLTNDTGFITNNVSGITTVSQSTQGTPTLTIKNTGGQGTGTGTGAQIAKFVGDSDALLIQNISGGDYGIYNIEQDNGIEFFDGTGGVKILYNGNIGVEFDSGNTYGDFKGVPIS